MPPPSDHDPDTDLLAAIVESSYDAIIGKDLDGRITSWNAAAQALFGYSAQEIIGRPVAVLIPPDRSAEEVRILASLAHGIRVPPFDTVRRAKDGGLREVSLTISPIHDAQGRVVGASKIVRDVTAQRRAEAALLDSEARLRFALEAARIGDWDLDLVDGSTRRSLHHDRCFGYDSPCADWSFETFAAHVHPDDRELVVQRFGLAVAEQTDWHVECRVVWPDRSIHWIRVDGSIRQAHGQHARMLGIVVDITGQKLAEELLRDSSAYARSLIEASLDPLVTISAQGKITDVNEASVQATGVAREQLIGRDFCDYFSEPQQARQGYRKAFSEGFVRNYPLAIRHSGGQTMDVLYNAAVYRDDQGAVQGVVAAARDITERNRLDRVLLAHGVELERAKATAETANQAKSDFLSSMSHELRSPLNAILGFAQLIESGSPRPTPAQKDSLDQILQAGWYLLALINDLLDLEVIESGRLSLSLESIALAEVLADCRAMIEPQAGERGIRMDFPPPDGAGAVRADRTRLKQVLVNLLSNAIKYNRPGGTVTLRCAPAAARRLRVSVADTGLGLSPPQLAQLFQPFNRLGQEAGAEQGTGIGLVVSKRLVERMGGEIGVSSEPGIGSVFWFELDTAPAAAAAAESSEPDGAAPALAPAHDIWTLLCIEDNPANLMLVERFVARRPGIRLLTARNAARGLEIARAARPDVVLMDINLSGLSGLDALRDLAGDPATARIPVIALSANARPDDIAQGLAAGFFRYLTKPVRFDELMDTLDEALANDKGETTRRTTGARTC